MKISVIIPCFKALGKIERCLASLRQIDFPTVDYEVLFIDDVSPDGTYEMLVEECAKEINWHVERLEQNSGSPSRPRNVGVVHARGAYVFFLDCDDEILPDTLRLHYEHAAQTDACIVRGYLLADDGKTRTPMNRLEGWHSELSLKERIELIIQRQSTTCSSLIRTNLLQQEGIVWPEEIRMGEDTLFLISTLSVAKWVEYIDHPTFVYNKRATFTLSSTQSYGAKELRDHLVVWTSAQEKLNAIGIDFFQKRLAVGLRVALQSLIFRNRSDIDLPTFEVFSRFVLTNWGVISSFTYIERLRDILAAVHQDDYLLFKRLCRPRLLIAGCDLKFILPVVPDLETYFDIRIDEWKGHDTHDEKSSRELLAWAELVWCEWLLGNAVWYAANKRPDQRLVVRMHRFELGRDFGEKARVEKIDAYLTVSVLFFERLLERFPAIPRSKVRHLPNYVKTDDYRHSFNKERLYTLGMIGILPSRKGLDVALRILMQLRQKDSRYCLKIFGQQIEALPWLKKDDLERAYFSRCREFIESNDLGGAVKFLGHCDVKTELEKQNVGFILSVSEPMKDFPGPESFHLAVTDGFAGGGVGLVLRWDGCEFIFPEEFIFDSQEAMIDQILTFTGSPQKFRVMSKSGRSFIAERYGVDKFVAGVRNLFLELN